MGDGWATSLSERGLSNFSLCEIWCPPALRACLETTRGAAARDFGCGQGGEVEASPQRAVTTEPTPATDKRPAARTGFAEKAGLLQCPSVEDPPGIFSFVAPRHPAFSPRTAPL